MPVFFRELMIIDDGNSAYLLIVTAGAAPQGYGHGRRASFCLCVDTSSLVIIIYALIMEKGRE